MTLPVPRLMAITDPAAPLGPELDAWLAELAAAGVDALQVRRKELRDRDLLALVARCRRALPASMAVLVNGRVDVALAAGAQGVHLPAAGLPTEAVRRLVRRSAPAGSPLLVGRSAHTSDEVARAREEGADYATFGPVFATPSKEAYGAPPGVAGLRAAVGASGDGFPVLALGGIGAGGIAEVAAAGAYGAAAIRAFYRRGEREQLVAAARQAWGPVVDSRPPP